MKVVINIEQILVVSYGWLYFHFYRVTEISIEFMCQKELFSRSLNEFPYDVLYAIEGESHSYSSERG